MYLLFIKVYLTVFYTYINRYYINGISTLCVYKFNVSTQIYNMMNTWSTFYCVYIILNIIK